MKKKTRLFSTFFVIILSWICVCDWHTDIFPFQQSLGEEPSTPNGPSGRYEPGHCQIQHIQPQRYQAAAAEAPGTCWVHTHAQSPPTDTNKHHWHHLSSIFIRKGKSNTLTSTNLGDSYTEAPITTNSTVLGVVPSSLIFSRGSSLMNMLFTSFDTFLSTRALRILCHLRLYNDQLPSCSLSSQTICIFHFHSSLPGSDTWLSSNKRVYLTLRTLGCWKKCL